MANRTVGIKAEGLPKLRRALRAAGHDVEDLKAANAAAAALVAGASRTRAPRRTGRLARSVRGNRAAGRATIRAGGAAVPYAGPIHWGWPAHHIRPQPFIAAAAQDTEAAWLPAYREALDHAVDRVAGRTYQ